MDKNSNKAFNVSLIILIALTLMITFFIIVTQAFLPREMTYDEFSVKTFDNDWYVTLPNGTRMATEIPCAYDVPRGEVFVLEKYLPSTLKPYYFLCFKSQHEDFTFYVDGKKVYQYSMLNNPHFGTSSPSAFVFLEIMPHYIGKTLKIEVTSSTRYSGTFSSIYYAQKGDFWLSEVNNHRFEIISFSAMLVCGFLCVLYAIFSFFFRHRLHTIGLLGLLQMIAGTWIFTNLHLRQLVFPNMSMASDIPFLMIMLLPITGSLFIYTIQKCRYPKCHVTIAILSTINLVVCALLRLTSVLPYEDTIFSTAVFILLFMLSAVITMIMDVYNGGIKDYKITAVGFLIALICGLAQLYIYLSKALDISGIFLCVGLMALVFASILDAILDYRHKITERDLALESSHAKAQFLANMSHEIRTPINAVLGMNEMILRESQDNNILEYATDIEHAGQSLLALINDILDYSKIESNKLDIVPVEYYPASLLNDAYNLVIERARKKDLDLRVQADPEIPATLRGDEVRLRQILTNLLTNAIKYTDRGNVTLKAFSEKAPDGKTMLTLSVIDTGIGIKDEDKDVLFSSFQRLDQIKNRNVEGTGLGLAITHNLVELMGGTISVESTYGVGSTFTCTIPQEIINESPMGTLSIGLSAVDIKNRPKNTLRAPSANILVVDDVEMNLKVFKSLLKDTNISIDTATSGIECLNLTRQFKYNIIFLDHMMPEMDGVETYNRLKADESSLNKTTPVIMLTANALSGAKEEYLMDGFTDYLSKPIKMSSLEELLYKYLPNDLIEQ